MKSTSNEWREPVSDEEYGLLKCGISQFPIPPHHRILAHRVPENQGRAENSYRQNIISSSLLDNSHNRLCQRIIDRDAVFRARNPDIVISVEALCAHDMEFSATRKQSQFQ